MDHSPSASQGCKNSSYRWVWNQGTSTDSPGSEKPCPNQVVAVKHGVSPIVGQAHFHDSFPHFDWLNLHFGWFWKIPISIGRILIWVKPRFLINSHIFCDEINSMLIPIWCRWPYFYPPPTPETARVQQRFDGPAFGCLGHGIGAPTEDASVFLGGLGGHLGDRPYWPYLGSANKLW